MSSTTSLWNTPNNFYNHMGTGLYHLWCRSAKNKKPSRKGRFRYWLPDDLAYPFPPISKATTQSHRFNAAQTNWIFYSWSVNSDWVIYPNTGLTLP